jgi:hypothetical protein
MLPFSVDNGDLHIVIERRGIYRLPFHGGVILHGLIGVFDQIICWCLVKLAGMLLAANA